MQSKKLFTPIKDIGLKRYLNQTAAEHNQLAYSDFVQLLEVAKHPSGKINKASVARAFGVDERTVGNWLEHFDKEATNG